MKIVLDWQISSYFGWGIYGLNLALEWEKIPGVEAATLLSVAPEQISVDALRALALLPFIERSRSRDFTGATRVHALDGEIATDSPDAKIGVIFFEEPLTEAAIARAKRFDLIVAGSAWNEAMLLAAGVENVRTILQGVDPSLFAPAPKRGLFPGRFLIFSGGKAEPRKGQDIVIKAFRTFAARHPEAMLVTSWHSPWPQLAADME